MFVVVALTEAEERLGTRSANEEGAVVAVVGAAEVVHAQMVPLHA